MVEPIITAAAITAGAGLAGSLLGGGDNNNAIKFAEKQAKKRIQWTVRDAQRAGIHPLYALGAGYQPPVMPSSGSSLGEGISRAGAAVGEGVRALGAKKDREAEILAGQPQAQANLAYTVANTDLIKQNIEASRLAMMMQSANNSGYGRGAVTGTPLDMATMIDPSGDITMMNTMAGWNYPPRTHQGQSPTVPAREWEEQYEDPASSVYGAARYGYSRPPGRPNWGQYYEKGSWWD